MAEPLLLPPEVLPGKPVWRRWKWIGLSAFALVLILQSWLPGILVFFGWLCGVAVIGNLAFHTFRYLKSRLFWRVRNRIVGSFVFVGFIPLLLLAGTAFLTGYLLLGQLSTNYIERSMAEFQREIAAINEEMARQFLVLAPPQLEAVAARVFRANAAHFPRLAARVVRRNADGGFEQVWEYDPDRFLPPGDGYPAQKWVRPDGTYEGFLVAPKKSWIATLQPLSLFPGFFLDV